jgi:hypothetical protein
VNLPPLEWQIVYGRLAWAVVLATLVLTVARRWMRTPRPAIVGISLASLLISMAPGGASPAYWLGLAFQWPSALGLALCVLALRAHWRADFRMPLLPAPMAAALALSGALLYLDASGWIALGLYATGFSGQGGPMFAAALGALCVLAIAHDRCRPQATAVLAALLAYMVLRLPTGNLWDALLDPFVWCVSVVELARHAWRAYQRSSGPSGYLL